MFILICLQIYTVLNNFLPLVWPMSPPGFSHSSSAFLPPQFSDFQMPKWFVLKNQFLSSTFQQPLPQDPSGYIYIIIYQITSIKYQ